MTLIGASERRPDSFTVLVCRGCCCGTAGKHPDVPHGEHLRRINDAIATLSEPRSRVRVTDCLGPCRHSNVVVVRPHRRGRPGDRDAVWLGEMLTQAAIDTLTAWIRAGGPSRCRLPPSLEAHMFDPRTPSSPSADEPIAFLSTRPKR